MMKSTSNYFNWPSGGDVCWVTVNHVLSISEIVGGQSAGAHGYCLSEKEFDILKLFENFSV